MEERLKVYIGWDSREDIAFQVAKQSILDHASIPVDIIPIKQKVLRKEGIYTRPEDKLGSTEFTFTRFLVPYLNEYKGWALFIDCDFLFKEDVKKLFDQKNDQYAVMCAQHDYTPKNKTKMDGQRQTNYPRKNWSSMMLINCEHPSNECLVPALINNETKTGAFFHRFAWLKDEEVGKISHTWNWLVGWYKEPKDGTPNAIHYTEGGPWFKQYMNCEYNIEWFETQTKHFQNVIQAKNDRYEKEVNRIKTISELDYREEYKDLLRDIVHHLTDPNGEYYSNVSEEGIMQQIKKLKEPKAAAIDSRGGINYIAKGMVYDEYLEAFIQGSGGRLSEWDKEESTDLPLIIRGLGGGSRKAIKHCWETSREFYAIDTGYFGNSKSKSKGWHRVTKNALQNLGPIVERPTDRLKRIGFNYKKFTNGKKILICPPSEKVMLLWGQPDPETWVNQVVTELKKYTDRPIEIRLKPNRTDRISSNTIEEALADNVHCLVTYNSIAATEALMNGKPAIALGPNAANVLCNTKLSEVERLNKPDKDTMHAFMAHLSYCQFSRQEMMNGYAWDIVNDQEGS